MHKWCSENLYYNHLSSEYAMKSQVLLTVWCNISGEAAGEIWHWSFSGMKGLTWTLSKVVILRQLSQACNSTRALTISMRPLPDSPILDKHSDKIVRTVPLGATSVRILRKTHHQHQHLYCVWFGRRLDVSPCVIALTLIWVQWLQVSWHRTTDNH